jgi:hypothetical protein
VKTQSLLAGSREPLGPSLSGVLYPMDSTNPAICVLPDRPASVMIHHSHNGSTPFHGYRGLSALVPLSLADSGSDLFIKQNTSVASVSSVVNRIFSCLMSMADAQAFA